MTILAVILFFAVGVAVVWYALKSGIKSFTGTTDVLSPDADDEQILDRSFKRKKAVIVAINRWADGDTLGGCDRDGANMLVEVFRRFGIDKPTAPILQDYWNGEAGFYKRIYGKDYDIRIVRNSRATAAFTRKLIAWLFSGVSAGDVRLLYWSGHGTQVLSTEEVDGLDECLVPFDFSYDKPSTHVLDNVVYNASKDVPAGANCTVLLDTCHSADFLRSPGKGVQSRFKKPPVWVTSGRTVKYAPSRTEAVANDSLLLLSGCTADSVSYTDTFPDKDSGGKIQEGALTNAFLEATFGRTAYIPMREIHALVYGKLSAKRNKQEPQLEGSERLKDKPFLEA